MDTELKRKEKIIQLEALLKSMVAIEEYELCIQIKRIIERIGKPTNDSPKHTQNHTI